MSTNQLIPIEAVGNDLVAILDTPKVRIALDVRMQKKTYRAHGWFLGWSLGEKVPMLRLQSPTSIKVLTVPLDAIQKAYWAPVGFDQT